MSDAKQLFSVSRAEGAVYKTGLRTFMEYRDLGIANATHGQFRAHVVRIKKDGPGAHDLHTTGLHQHQCDFQMFYVLKGWIKGEYDGQVVTMHAGAAWLQPPRIKHTVLDYSDDCELLEIITPADFKTVELE